MKAALKLPRQIVILIRVRVRKLTRKDIRIHWLLDRRFRQVWRKIGNDIRWWFWRGIDRGDSHSVLLVSGPIPAARRMFREVAA